MFGPVRALMRVSILALFVLTTFILVLDSNLTRELVVPEHEGPTGQDSVGADCSRTSDSGSAGSVGSTKGPWSRVLSLGLSDRTSTGDGGLFWQLT